MMERNHEHMLHVKVLTEALKRVAQEDMLQEMRELVLGDMKDAFRRGLAIEPPGWVTLT